MTALLIVAHGSRQHQANQEIEELVQRIKALAPDGVDLITHAFLQMGSPDVSERIAELAGQGVGRVLVFPYFTAAGTHVRHDLPRLIFEASSRHPDIRFTLTPHLAVVPGLERLILDHILATG